MEPRTRLASLTVSGYKSLPYDPAATITFGDVTVLLGANGAGKSNLVSFFRLLASMMAGTLQRFVAEQGFANALLHYGVKARRSIQADLEFRDGADTLRYQFALSNSSGDSLMVCQEKAEIRSAGSNDVLRVDFQSPGGEHVGEAVSQESLLASLARRGDEHCQRIGMIPSRVQICHLNDTSPQAPIRRHGYIDDTGRLREDAGNLAAFLRAMRLDSRTAGYYERIVRHIRLAMPQFQDFELDPSAENRDMIRLNWRDRRSGHLFGPHQIADGALRFMMLTALLLQSPSSLPPVIVIDEPELGLHPRALSAFAGMVRHASRHSQIILSTQSPRLVDEFDAGEIVVVEYDDGAGASHFHRLDTSSLASWLERYSLSELWEKNVIGGRP